jgi:hypothetical protein
MPHYALPLDRLQELSEAINASIDPTAVRPLLSELIRFCDVINFYFQYDRALWRGVRCGSAEGFANIQHVGHPPSHLTRNGRLNEAGEPILYASISQFAVLEEIGARAGEFVQIAGYRIKEGDGLKSCLVGEVTQVSRWGRALLSETVGIELSRILNRMSFDVGRSFVFTDSLLASLLRDPNASAVDYVRSRILAELLFGKVTGLEAIIYPSVAHEGAMNIAITPSAVQKQLSIESTCVLRIKKRYDFGIYDFEVVRKANGHRSDGTVEWQ